VLGGARPSHRALVRAVAERDLACEEVHDVSREVRDGPGGGDDG